MNVANSLVCLGWWNAVAFQPAIYVKKVNLLTPQQTGKCPALDHLLFRGRIWRVNALIELIRFLPSLLNHLIYTTEWVSSFLLGQSKAEDNRTFGRDSPLIMHAGLGT